MTEEIPETLLPALTDYEQQRLKALETAKESASLEKTTAYDKADEEFDTFKQQYTELFKKAQQAEKLKESGQKVPEENSQAITLILEKQSSLDSTKQRAERKYTRELQRIKLDKDKLLTEIHAERIKRYKEIQKGKEVEESKRASPKTVTHQGIISPIGSPIKISKLKEYQKAQLNREIEKLQTLQSQLRSVDSFLSIQGNILKEQEQKEYYEWKRQQVQKDQYIVDFRLNDRNRILKGERVTFDQLTEAELSDEGYSPLEELTDPDTLFQPLLFPIRNKVKKSKPRKVPPPLPETLLIQPGALPKVKRKTILAPRRNSDRTMPRNGNEYKDCPTFHGLPDEDGDTHLANFLDYLNVTGYKLPTGTDPKDIIQIIDLFAYSLKTLAKQWWLITYGPVSDLGDEWKTKERWVEIKQSFVTRFNAAGSTTEQQIKAWKDMKWKPEEKAIDSFVYEFQNLGAALGYTGDQLLQHFLCSIPPYLYQFIHGVKTIREAVERIKVHMTFNPHLIPQPQPQPQQAQQLAQLNQLQQLLLPQLLQLQQQQQQTTGQVPPLPPMPPLSQQQQQNPQQQPKTAAMSLMPFMATKEIDYQLGDMKHEINKLTQAVEKQQQYEKRDNKNPRRERDRSDSRDRSRERNRYRDKERDRDRGRDRRDPSRSPSRSRSPSVDKRKKRVRFADKATCEHCGKTNHPTADCWRLQNVLRAAGKSIVDSPKSSLKEGPADSMNYLNSTLQQMHLNQQQQHAQMLGLLGDMWEQRPPHSTTNNMSSTN